jgi:hypothetical protein
MADQRRPSSSARGPRDRGGDRRPPAPLTGPITVDEATANALALFNARLAAQAENERAERRVQKAAKAKDDAAARVRALEADTKATAEQRAEAAAGYRHAVEAWERAKSGEPEPAAAGASPSTDAGDADETAADETAADETAADEGTDAGDAGSEGDAGAQELADAADDAPAATDH